MKAKICKASFSGSEKEPTKFTAIITTSAIDRDHEVVVPAGMNSKDYERNPVLLYAHDPNKPIGKMLSMRRGDSAIDADFVLAPRPDNHEGEWLPDTIGSLMRFGALNGVSIQFAPIEGGMRKATKADSEKYGGGVKNVYSKWKLLEVSVVSIPANQEAIISAVSKGICTRASLDALGVIVEKNCGVGADGFESGNNCAGGGGSGAGGEESPASTRQSRVQERKKNPPVVNSTTKVRGEPLAAGMDAPKTHDFWLPRTPKRMEYSEFTAALASMGYEKIGDERWDGAGSTTNAPKGVQMFTLRDSSGHTAEMRVDHIVRAIYANSVHDDLNSINVPAKKPRKYLVSIIMPSIGTDEVAKIARHALAKVRGTFR